MTSGAGAQPDAFMPAGPIPYVPMAANVAPPGFAAFAATTQSDWQTQLEDAFLNSIGLGQLVALCNLIAASPFYQDLKTFGDVAVNGVIGAFIKATDTLADDVAHLSPSGLLSGNTPTTLLALASQVAKIGEILFGDLANVAATEITALEKFFNEFVIAWPSFPPSLQNDLTSLLADVQAVWDAILATVGWAAGAGTAADVTRYFTDFLAMFANPALTSAGFNASTAVGTFITSMIAPHNLLAPMDPVTQLVAATHIPALTAGWGKTIDGSLLVGTVAAGIVSGALTSATLAATALTAGAIGAGVTIAGSALTSAISAANVPALPAGWGKTVDGSLIAGTINAAIITGVLNQSQIPALTSSWGKTIDGAVLTNAITTATLAASKLTSGAIPAGVTIAGSALTSAITAANVPALPAGWGKTIDGALIAGTVLSTSVIPTITPPMTSGLALIDDVTNAILATSILGNTVDQMQYALTNMPNVNVQPIVGTVASDLGASLQAHIDAGIQAITGSTASGNPLSLFQTAFGQFTNHVGVVTVSQPYVPPASVTAVSHANNSYIQQQSVNYEIAHAVDPTCNGPFDLSTIALAALSTVTVAQGTAVQCFDHIPFGGVKQSVRWLGNPSSGASFTDFRVNIYRLDTTTGIETLVYASENIAAAISASSTPVWKAYNTPSGAVQTLSLGTSATPPTGPGFPYTFPFPLVAAPSFTLTFSGQTTTAIPYPATTVPIQNALAALSNIGTGNVLVCDIGGGDFFITFAGTMAATTHPLITVDSTLLPNTTPTVNDFLIAGQGDVFAAEIVVAGTGNYNIVGITNNLPVHTTAIPARFAATRVVGSPNFTYSAATPWIGLASTNSTSAPGTPIAPAPPPPAVPPVFNPVLLGWGSSTVIANPAATYPLANYFDVIIFGGGGGGAAGNNLSGSVGGYAAPHAVWSGVTRALMGTAGVTINVGGGGYGGGSTGAPGGNGGGSSVVIPGWTTLSVGGGAGNSGASSSFYGGPGQNESSATWSDAYYNPQGLAGGAGGQSPQAAGALPGGGGAGGSATLVGANIYGGAGGGGAVYIYCYQ